MPGWTRGDFLRINEARAEMIREERATVKAREDELRARENCRPHGSVDNVFSYGKRCGCRSGGEG